MNVKNLFNAYKVVVILTVVYLFFTLWRNSFGLFPGMNDPCFYHKLAENISKGRGLVIDFIWHYGIKPDAVIHPIDNVWHPLSALIIAPFYYVLGVSRLAGQLPVLLLHLVLCIAIYFFCTEHLKSRTAAFFSCMVFIVHSTLADIRLSGGTSEGFLLFFVFFTCLFLGKWLLTDNRIHLFAAAFCGGLAYLSRNEGGLTLLLVVSVFLYSRFFLKSQRDTTNRAYLLLLIAVVIFFLVASPWELRNRILYGSQANAGKYNYLLSNHYYDCWSYSKEFTVSSFLAYGPKRILHRLFTSYGLKIDLFVERTSWPVLIFLMLGFLKYFRNRAFFPAFAYFVISYIIMGAVNSVGFQGGWNGIYLMLPFIIPLAIGGIFYFSEQLTPNRKAGRIISIILASFVFIYHIGLAYKAYHLYNKSPKTIELMEVLKTWAAENDTQDSVVFTYDPINIHYYTGLKTIMIPTNEPVEVIFECMDRYKPDYLLLAGSYHQTLNDLYYGKDDYGRFKLVYERDLASRWGELGERLMIFRISYD